MLLAVLVTFQVFLHGRGHSSFSGHQTQQNLNLPGSRNVPKHRLQETAGKEVSKDMNICDSP